MADDETRLIEEEEGRPFPRWLIPVIATAAILALITGALVLQGEDAGVAADAPRSTSSPTPSPDPSATPRLSSPDPEGESDGDGTVISGPDRTPEPDPDDPDDFRGEPFPDPGGEVPVLASTSLASRASDGGFGDGASGESSISGDGRYVAFDSEATDLVADDMNDASDVFVRDLEKDETILVSVGTDGTPGAGHSESPAISGDGRYVAFVSMAPDLVAEDANGFAPDVFVRDLQKDETTLVSVNMDGESGRGFSFSPSISADGRYVAFASDGPDLVAGDTNDATDVFVRDRGTEG